VGDGSLTKISEFVLKFIMTIKRSRTFFFFFFILSILSPGMGCATLPNIGESRQIHWDEWKKRTLIPRLREWFVNLFSHWL